MSKRIRRTCSIVSGTLLAAMAAGWGTIFFGGGQAGALAWWLLIGFGFVGAGTLLLVMGLLIRGLSTRRSVTAMIGPLFLSMAAAAPIGILFGVWPVAYPANRAAVVPAAEVRLPFREPAVTGWGGDDIAHNRHATWPMERWAYDFMMEPALTGSDRLTDYGIYGADVVAPAAGTIVGAYDDEADQPPGTENYDSLLGNYVYLRLNATGTYLVLAHLKQGSVQVKEGQRVDEGDLLGQSGNSGASSEPHLHLHHQRQDPSKTSMYLSEGLPLYFRDVDGPRMPKGGIATKDGKEVLAGDRLAPLTP
ncbi:M23 family metallopeptidase [Paenibacillus aurantiacus]|uniref:M23 family metallopeptidase n=1 Tax=Paenibacillus aurantiacus TaxID=1936118 RepID=A0ABV5KXM8_9BACL